MSQATGLNRLKNPSNEKSILIIRFSSLGDIILTEPVIASLRKEYPGAIIDFLVRKEYTDLVRYNKNLNDILIFDTGTGFAGLKALRRQIKRADYDWIIDLHGSLRSRFICRGQRAIVGRIKKNQFLRFLLVRFHINLYRKLFKRIPRVPAKYLSAVEQVAGSAFHPPEGYIPAVRAHLPDNTIFKGEAAWAHYEDRGFGVIMAPGARHFTKRWPASYYAFLISEIYKKHGKKTLLLGGPEERETADEIVKLAVEGAVENLAGKYTLLETIAIISRTPFFVGNDSALMHAAAAFDIPQAVIFGSTVEEFGFYPNSEKAVVFHVEGLKCRPCTHIGRSACPKTHFRCMLDIRPQEVLEFYESLPET